MKEMKQIRKKVCSMILCAGMFLAAGTSASALEVDYQYMADCTVEIRIESKDTCEIKLG